MLEPDFRLTEEKVLLRKIFKAATQTDAASEARKGETGRVISNEITSSEKSHLVLKSATMTSSWLILSNIAWYERISSNMTGLFLSHFDLDDVSDSFSAESVSATLTRSESRSRSFWQGLKNTKLRAIGCNSKGYR